jgi:hypothetical protein
MPKIHDKIVVENLKGKSICRPGLRRRKNINTTDLNETVLRCGLGLSVSR